MTILPRNVSLKTPVVSSAVSMKAPGTSRAPEPLTLSVRKKPDDQNPTPGPLLSWLCLRLGISELIVEECTHKAATMVCRRMRSWKVFLPHAWVLSLGRGACRHPCQICLEPCLCESMVVHAKLTVEPPSELPGFLEGQSALFRKEHLPKWLYD